LSAKKTDHYATLGLHQRCTEAQIRAAYRLLAKQCHPDVNGGSASSQARTRELNAAYEILSDPHARAEYDAELAAPKLASPTRSAKNLPIVQEAQLRIEELLRGTTLEVRVNDPGNPDGVEIYSLTIPAGTAPSTKFRVDRDGGGKVTVKIKVRPDFRFKTRGSDLRCDLKIKFQRAQSGGTESVRGVNGNFIRVEIPRNVTRGEVIRVDGEGLPKTRGGRGDLLVRVMYQPEVRITRQMRR
jgi:curved DNA-binding protein